MASPQTENGYLRIANELQDAFCMVDLSGSAWRCLHTILRKTYGYHKKKDAISLSQFEQLTGMTRKGVAKGLNELEQKSIIHRCRDGYITSYEVNKNYDAWGSVQNDTSVQLYTRSSVQLYTKSSVQNDTHKRKKDKKILANEIRRPLKGKKKDIMGWENKNSDNDDDLPSVDLESGEVVVDRPVKVKSRAPEVFELFKEILGMYPLNWRVNKTIRTAAENLMNERGEGKIKNALLFYRENKDREFCPTILTPYDLDSKWTKLAKFRNDNGL